MEKTYIVKNKETGEEYQVVKATERTVGEGETQKKYLDVDFVIGDTVGGIAFEVDIEDELSNERYDIIEKAA